MNKLSRLFVKFTVLCIFGGAIYGQQPTPAVVKIAPAIFDGYVGQYESKADLPGVVFSIYRDGEKFYGRVTGQDQFEHISVTVPAGKQD